MKRRAEARAAGDHSILTACEAARLSLPRARPRPAPQPPPTPGAPPAWLRPRLPPEAPATHDAAQPGAAASPRAARSRPPRRPGGSLRTGLDHRLGTRSWQHRTEIL